MQDWQQLLQSDGGSSLDKAKEYLKAQAAGDADAQAVMRCQNRKQRFWQRGMPMVAEMCVVVRCTCKIARCLRVVVVASVRRSVDRKSADPLSCPLHTPECISHSHGVERFQQALEQLGVDAKCVWDWHNVPGNSRMHVDATVLLSNGRACCFEIDSNLHLEPGKHERLDEDTEKDRLLDEAQLGMMRLHTFDVDLWPKYLHVFVSNEQHRVRYSAAYLNCVNDKSAIMRVEPSAGRCK